MGDWGLELGPKRPVHDTLFYALVGAIPSPELLPLGSRWLPQQHASLISPSNSQARTPHSPHVSRTTLLVPALITHVGGDMAPG